MTIKSSFVCLVEEINFFYIQKYFVCHTVASEVSENRDNLQLVPDDSLFPGLNAFFMSLQVVKSESKIFLKYYSSQLSVGLSFHNIIMPKAQSPYRRY